MIFGCSGDDGRSGLATKQGEETVRACIIQVRVEKTYVSAQQIIAYLSEFGRVAFG
jgi:hypothetical protein